MREELRSRSRSRTTALSVGRAYAGCLTAGCTGGQAAGRGFRAWSAPLNANKNESPRFPNCDKKCLLLLYLYKYAKKRDGKKRNGGRFCFPLVTRRRILYLCIISALPRAPFACCTSFDLLSMTLTTVAEGVDRLNTSTVKDY